MDANKRQKLLEVGYRVVATCGFCGHSTFPGGVWGTCQIHTYEHRKHTDAKRHLSIHKNGTCSRFEADAEKTAELGLFLEFLA